MNKKLIINFLIILIFFLIISGFFSLLTNPFEKTEEITIDNFIRQLKEGKIKAIVVEENKVNLISQDNKKMFFYKEEKETLTSILNYYQVSPEILRDVSQTIKPPAGKNVFLQSILPSLLPLILLIGILYFFSRQIRGGAQEAFRFGESQAREIRPGERTKVTFKDVAGVKEAKEELKEIVDFLKKPKKFTALGAKIPKGVLLMGPPGCGKTLLARAVAGEAQVPFFHISGSEFVEMFVGVGASRVRSLFQKAKKNLPCIVFIDELDAVGRQRGAGLGGSHDEREQTLNQILVEMDGFEPNIGLIVISATNRPDVLDPALLRPGRFDRRIVLDMPDVKDREEILKIHARGKPLAKNVSLKKIAERTPGFSGADLANLMNEAAILAARREKDKIYEKEVLESIEKVLLGPERKSHLLSEKERKVVAYHEAGHALVAHSLPHCDPVQKVSIIARGQAAGYTLKMPEKERYLKFKSEFLDNLSALLGGYVAEEEIFGEVTTGAANDLKQATELAKKLVTEFGMSEILGPRTFGERHELIFLGREIAEQKDYSEKSAQIIDEEVSRFINQCYTKAKEVVKTKREFLEKIAKKLLEKETLEKEEFLKIFN
ncbi:MAG: ATP-dependent zinc metalloprotease FtsH [Patescibacteria group bacterium]|nr:ATP-dependent zinc metalloprotease FtsH [Patescibacteria group bacterium]